MDNKIVQGLFAFIESSPSPIHTVYAAERKLKNSGFVRIEETDIWQLEPGGKYYVVRGMTSIAAFRYPGKNYQSYAIVASHGDSPCFRVKGEAEMQVSGKYTRLNTEAYGGLNLNLWMDRPLSIAGRVMIKTEKGGVKAQGIQIDRDLMLIPSLAIHMNREVNNGVKLNPQRDTLPLLGMEEADFTALLASELNVRREDILAHDLYLYNRQKGVVFGEKQEFIAAPKLDDLQCVYASLEAICTAQNPQIVTVCAIFDNEEIGSVTKQGAASNFLADVLSRIAETAGKTPQENRAALAGSFALSADNAHAVHPNDAEKSDPTNRCYLNGGVVVKNSPRYATDAVSEAVFRCICARADVPVQRYYNRSDQPGGSTLGNLLNMQVSIHTIDIGCPQIAMHSPFETAGVKDTAYMINAMTAFYESVITIRKEDLFEVTPVSHTEKKTERKDGWEDIFTR